MQLNLLTTFGSLAIVYGVSLPVGYLIANRLSHRFNHNPFFIKFPIYIALGIISLVPLYLLTALASVTFWTPLLISVVPFIYILAEHKVSRERIKKSITVTSFDNMLPLALFLATTSFFVLTVSYMGWPPPGDVSNAHGPFVSLIEYYGRLNLRPVLINVVYYPQGLHVTAATFNTLTNLYPAQVVFILGASFIILIPPLIYSLTYSATNSKLLSLLAFSSVFIPHPSLNLEKWIVGYFYNGPYACLMGYLIVFTFAGALVNLNQNIQETNWLPIRKLLLLVVLVFISLLITYPNFAVLITPYAVIILIMFRSQIYQRSLFMIRKFLGSSTLIKVLLVVSASTLIVILYSVTSVSWSLFTRVFSSYLPMAPHAYVLSSSWFYDNINGIASIIASFCAIHQLLNKRRFHISLLYICLITMVLLSLNETICSSILWIILPSRSVIIASVLSWPMILIAIYDSYSSSNLYRKIQASLFKSRYRPKPVNVTQKATAMFLISLFVLSLCAYLVFEQTTRWGGFARTPEFSDDFLALEWIDKNVPSNALILNDGSFSSRYMLSLSVKNLTLHVWTESMFPKRAADLFMIWQQPKKASYIIAMLLTYNVSYILSTSEEGYLITSELEHALDNPEYHSGYFKKLFTPEEYAEIFSRYLFLVTVFASNNTRIYRVLM